MATVSRSGTLERPRHSGLLANRDECLRVFLPGFLVEVHRQKPASIVCKQRVNTYCVLSSQVIANNPVRQRQKRSSLALDLLTLSRLGSSNSGPILDARRRVAKPTVAAFPSHCIDIVSSAEEPAKQSDLFAGWRLPRTVDETVCSLTAWSDR